ncbi:MAG: hypothetical protein LBQ60_11975 [Bacteroidales bacterium]|jgi:hypothetical protein|nr:hypothetical protein [Bacteroidales bacterium]
MQISGCLETFWNDPADSRKINETQIKTYLVWRFGISASELGKKEGRDPDI